ncbi:MAG: hypothetical protein IT236_04615 [Bacteroidia bacterium]|nr:hypothetical protein [Bacteroidia bacterium]
MFLKIIFIISTLFNNNSIFFGQKKAVTVKLNYYQPYCGGARPSRDMEAEAQKPKPYANYMVIIVSDKGSVDSVKTNIEGEIKTKLKPGTYKVFEKWRYYKSTPDGNAVANYDKECLKTEWGKETGVITVTKKTSGFTETNNIVFDCAWKLPCLREDKKFMPE